MILPSINDARILSSTGPLMFPLFEYGRSPRDRFKAFVTFESDTLFFKVARLNQNCQQVGGIGPSTTPGVT